MEEITCTFENHGNLVFLCKKCYENKQYYIPLYKRNKQTNSIEYECPKSHIIKEEDILKVKLNKKLKKFLNNCECQNHQDNTFCGWCEDCRQNICFFCVAEKLKKKHNYILFMTIVPSIETQIIYNNQINKLKDLYKDYNFYCPNLKKEINILSTLIIYSDITFNLYYNEKIQNYQTINNIFLNFKELQKEIDLLESIFNKNKYIFFFQLY